MDSCIERRDEIARMLERTLEDEKPSGRWKMDQPVIAADGTVLSRHTDDPDFFLGTRTPEEHEALMRANSVVEPGENGLTWKDFSRARGYSEEEIGRFAQIEDLYAQAGLRNGELAHAAGHNCLLDAFEMPEGFLEVAAILEERTCTHKDSATPK